MWKGKEPRCFQRSSIFWSLHRCPRLTRRILLLSSPPLVPIALSPCTRKGHHAHLSSVTSRPHVSTVVVVVPHQEWGSSSTKKKEKQPHIGTEQDAVTKDCTDQTAWLTCFVRQKWGKCKKKHRNLHCCFQDEGTCQDLGFVHHPPWLQMERKQKHTNLNMFKESLHERR